MATAMHLPCKGEEAMPGVLRMHGNQYQLVATMVVPVVSCHLEVKTGMINRTGTNDASVMHQGTNNH